MDVIDPTLLRLAADGDIRLLASRCSACGQVSFPAQTGCAKCTERDMTPVELPSTGTLWAWTVQCFEPKPPYVRSGDEFVPYAVGYVELPDALRVESRLTDVDFDELEIGLPMELTSLAVPILDAEALTFAFRPVRASA